MSKKTEFINFIESKITDWSDASNDVLCYWDAFKGKDDVEKPMFTDNGKLILSYMQKIDSTDGKPLMKARDIAEGLFISSRTVSGAIRKLVTDGFVEKIGQDPTLYSITEKGKNIEIV